MGRFVSGELVVAPAAERRYVSAGGDQRDIWERTEGSRTGWRRRESNPVGQKVASGVVPRKQPLCRPRPILVAPPRESVSVRFRRCQGTVWAPTYGLESRFGSRD